MLKSLWKITAVVYGTLLLSGEVLKWALGCSRLTVPLSYGFGMVAFYLWHMMAHKNIRVWPLSSVHAAHMDHHWRIYPPTSAKFLSTKPLHSLAGIRARPQWVPKWFPDIEHEMVLILMIAFNQFALGPFVFSASFAECFSGFCLCMIAGGIMVYTHESTHIRGHWAEKYEWFQDLRALHLMHHRGAINTNYGMYSFLTDSVLGSYQDPTETTPVLSQQAEGRKHPMEEDGSPEAAEAPPGLLLSSVLRLTGKETYRFGDISHNILQRLQQVSAGDLLAKFSLGL